MSHEDKPVEHEKPLTLQPEADLRWFAFIAGIIVVCWQALFGYTTVGQASDATIHTVANMGAILLGLAAIVLSLVSLQRRRSDNWPALIGLALGAEGFIVHLATWLGTL